MENLSEHIPVDFDSLSQPTPLHGHPGVFVIVIVTIAVALVMAVGSRHSGSLLSSLDQVGDYYSTAVPFP